MIVLCLFASLYLVSFAFHVLQMAKIVLPRLITLALALSALVPRQHLVAAQPGFPAPRLPGEWLFALSTGCRRAHTALGCGMFVIRPPDGQSLPVHAAVMRRPMLPLYLTNK